MNLILKIFGAVMAIAFLGASYAIAILAGVEMPNIQTTDTRYFLDLTADQLLYTGIGIAAVTMAAAGMLFFKAALEDRQFFLAFIILIMFFGAEFYTLRMELRYATMTQSDGIAERTKLVGQDSNRAERLETIKGKLVAIGNYRASTVIVADIDKIHNTIIKKGRSRGKTIANATRNFTRDNRFTQKYGPTVLKLKQELVSSKEGERLSGEQNSLWSATAAQPAITEATPDAAWLARNLTIIDESGAVDFMMITLIIFLAFGRIGSLPIMFIKTPPTGGRKVRKPEHDKSNEQPSTKINLDGKVIELNAHKYKKAIKNLVEGDIELQFVAKVLVEEPGEHMFCDILEKYRNYAMDNHVEALGPMQFAGRLRDMKILSAQKNNKRSYVFGEWTSRDIEVRQINLDLVATR